MNPLDDLTDVQSAQLNTIEATFENLRNLLNYRLNQIKDDVKNQYIKKTKDSKEKLTVNPATVKSFEYYMQKQMLLLKRTILSDPEDTVPLNPSFHSKVEVLANIGFNYGANAYFDHSSSIIAAPSNGTLMLYNSNGTENFEMVNRVKI
mmetsp:Transcript_26165/g.23013  ORF Transcript_26165/g.23013 Transcript_26165/m.23013 type:complete len:149 (+) Transcript_26165:105-551(+)